MKLAFILISVVVLATLTTGAFLKSTGMLIFEFEMATGHISIETQTFLESVAITIMVCFILFTIGYRIFKGDWVWNNIKGNGKSVKE